MATGDLTTTSQALRNLVTPRVPSKISGLEVHLDQGVDADQFAACYKTIFGSVIACGRVGRADVETKSLGASMFIAALGLAAQATKTTDPADLIDSANRFLNQGDALKCVLHLGVMTWDASEQLLICATVGDFSISNSANPNDEVCDMQPAIGLGKPIECVPVWYDLDLETSVTIERSHKSNCAKNAMATVARSIDL